MNKGRAEPALPFFVLVGAAFPLLYYHCRLRFCFYHRDCWVRAKMARKAVDVVLLPDEAMTDMVLAANAKLSAAFGDRIVLSRRSCLPHISLAMGCIEGGDILPAGELLRDIAQRYAPDRLKVAAVEYSTSFSGEVVSVFAVDRTERLQRLHEKVMTRLERYFSYDVAVDMISGRRADESTLGWIKNYPAMSSYVNFSPHITIGYGKYDGGDFPIEFGVSRLALCHLGNHCTCREVLLSAEPGG